jgi:hypothetical protein
MMIQKCCLSDRVTQGKAAVKAKVNRPRIEKDSDEEGLSGSSDGDTPLPGEIDEDSSSDTVIEEDGDSLADQGTVLSIDRRDLIRGM